MLFKLVFCAYTPLVTLFDPEDEDAMIRRKVGITDTSLQLNIPEEFYLQQKRSDNLVCRQCFLVL